MNRFIKFPLMAAGLALALTSVVTAADALPKLCVVNGDEFAGRKNPPIQVTHAGESIQVCCKKCARKFEKSPDKYIKKYKEALKEEGASNKGAGAATEPGAATVAGQPGECCSTKH